MKSGVTVILLVFVAASVVYLVVGERGDGPSGERDETSIEPSRGGSAGIPTEEVPIPRPATRGGEAPADAIAGSKVEPETVARPAGDGPGRTVIVYYFHRTQRCSTCLAMQSYAQEALREGLSAAMDSGALAWRAVNVEDAEHEHFVKDYELYASALIMVDSQDGQVRRSKKLEEIWDLVDDETAFKTFVRNEAQSYLQEAQ